ncbi:DUF1308 and/or Chorein N domain containing protein [Asbolus verrucosus]|uniref:DUF1308 and/or Chorein N domain containing protein n=1 Tax=Asbolus verrucosus TaxID=1661398 RepID=A0A482VMN2_ASBVE|nr:DUF1308 and/or Chorein N domain containing protein [Asbolus verrucosus]
MGDASYGVRSVIDQAEDYIESARLYPCLFQIPKVVFVFINGVGNNLATKIESFGIKVEGTRITDVDITEEIDEKSNENSVQTEVTQNMNNLELSTPNISHITKINLDVSAMLAYVSSVTNGSADMYEFSVHVLAQQAKWERQRPQKPILDSFFEGKKLYCCQTAKDNFINIVNTVGGLNEKKRAEDFLKRITVLPDNATAENTIEDSDKDELFKNVQLTPEKSLSVGGKIRERSLIIFTFGDRIGAVTVTANDGFVRSAKQQGIDFVVFIHESRALTEQKELTKGDVKLTNLVLKQSALDDLDLPLQTVYGRIGKLVLKIPWKNLYGAAFVINIEDIYLLASPNQQVKFNAVKESLKQFEAKKREILKVELAKKQEAEKGKDLICENQTF